MNYSVSMVDLSVDLFGMSICVAHNHQSLPEYHLRHRNHPHLGCTQSSASPKHIFPIFIQIHHRSYFIIGFISKKFQH